jgi:hypothetical protein
MKHENQKKPIPRNPEETEAAGKGKHDYSYFNHPKNAKNAKKRMNKRFRKFSQKLIQMEQSEDWYQQVTDNLSSKFFDQNEPWIMSESGTFIKWASKLAHKTPKQAAELIEKAFRIYKPKQ